MNPLNNNPLFNIMRMVNGGNPEQVAKNILNNNPEFSKQIQGKSPKELAINMLNQRGINPNEIMNIFNRRY